jgi:hypothetical protein
LTKAQKEKLKKEKEKVGFPMSKGRGVIAHLVGEEEGSGTS